MDLRLTRRALVAGLLVVATAAGCSDTGGSTAGDGSAERAATELNAALATDAQVEDASRRLIRECMEEKGFTTHPREDAAEPFQAGVYPFVDPPAVDAVAKGYPEASAEPDESAGGGSRDAFGRLSEAEQQRYEAALGEETVIQLDDGTEVGIPADGCGGKVAAELFGDVQGAFRTAVFARRGSDIAREQTVADQVVGEAVAGWSKCMEKAGFPGLADPESARDLTHTKGRDDAEVDEPALAAADARCGAEHQVSTVRRTAWERHLAEYLSGHEAEIAAYRESQETALANAQRMLQG
ncbi:hypothetical protein AB0M02_02765 [Actinoplanes sp. NPDC051861]|uniref:hypothetical protein n=1 Tax=Actinoplanes sp. NPDC051861 TaxID=3155170 RepID=UPI003439B362